jgi:hypothetical protein
MGSKIQLQYEKDFYAWALHHAKLLRQHKFLEMDVKHMAEEIEDMGKSTRRELMNRLAVLLAHLLKWKFQPERHGNSWKYTIQEQRFEMGDLLAESPSLRHELEKQISHAYQKALIIAVKEAGLSLNTFPEVSPFSLNDVLDAAFLPNHD